MFRRTHNRRSFSSPNRTNLLRAARPPQIVADTPKQLSSSSTLLLVDICFTQLGHRSANHVLKSPGRVAIDNDSLRSPGWVIPPKQTNESRSEVAESTSGYWGVPQMSCTEYERSPNLDKLPQYCVLHKITNLCMYDMLVALIHERVPITSFGGNRIIHLFGASSKKVYEYS